MVIHKKEILKYLSIVRNLKTDFTFYDIHVHPFEIIYDSFKYDKDPLDDNLYHLSNAEYRKPKIGDLDLTFEHATREIELSKSKLSNLVGLRKIYSHLGPTVLEEHLELSGIDEVLLLPVAQSSEPIDTQIGKMRDIYGFNPKFHFSCSVPNTTPNSETSQFIRKNIEKFKIKAIKLHPNITGINLSTMSGKERVGSILDACRQFKLPLIIHGGRSPILGKAEASEYGWIKNFDNINWDISTEPIVIAHAGGYGCELNEIEQDVLPILKKLFRRYSNIMIDISGLSFEALVLIFRQTDIEKILFGSDALYHRQWAGLIRSIYAFEKSVGNIEYNIAQIASINPSKYIFNRSRA